MIKVRLAGIVNDSIVDGPGIRMAIFFQGCKIGCPGCQNKETWDINGGYLEEAENIVARWKKNPLLDGITLTGGDPLLQKEAALFLLMEAKRDGLNTCLYSGQTFESLIELNDSLINGILKNTDYLVDGPFIESLKDGNLPYRGSSNQRIIDVKLSLKAKEVVLFNPF